MYAVSSQWDHAIRHSGARILQVDIYDRFDPTGRDSTSPGDPGYAPVGRISPGTLVVSNAQVESLSIEADRQSLIRRSASLVISDQRFYDIISSLDPNPIGLEFDIRMGIDYGDTSELVPMGLFWIETLDYDYGDIAISLRLVDRSSTLDIGLPVRVGPGEDIVPELEAFLITNLHAGFDDGVVDVLVDGDVTSTTPPSESGYATDTVLEYVSQALQDLGLEGYFGVEGDFHISNRKTVPPDADMNDAVWSVNVGSSGVITGGSISINLRDFANTIIYTYQDPDGVPPQLGGIVVDGDFVGGSYSLTSAAGPAFNRTKTYDFKTTVTLEAEMAAESILNEMKGLPKSSTFQSIANPALDVGDIIAVEFPNGDIEIHLVDSFTISEDWSMSLRTRGQRLA